MGLEELLEPKPIEHNGQPFIVDDRDDSLGNHPVLIWDPINKEAELVISGMKVKATGEQAYDALYHTYPFIYAKLGNTVVDKLVTPLPVAA